MNRLGLLLVFCALPVLASAGVLYPLDPADGMVMPDDLSAPGRIYYKAHRQEFLTSTARSTSTGLRIAMAVPLPGDAAKNLAAVRLVYPSGKGTTLRLNPDKGGWLQAGAAKETLNLFCREAACRLVFTVPAQADTAGVYQMIFTDGAGRRLTGVTKLSLGAAPGVAPGFHEADIRIEPARVVVQPQLLPAAGKANLIAKWEDAAGYHQAERNVQPGKDVFYAFSYAPPLRQFSVTMGGRPTAGQPNLFTDNTLQWSRSGGAPQ